MQIVRMRRSNFRRDNKILQKDRQTTKYPLGEQLLNERGGGLKACEVFWRKDFH